MLRGKAAVIFAAVANRPKAVVIAGWSSGAFFLLMSLLTHKWHWFPRGGAIMALCGFIVAVRETLLYRPYRPAETQTESGIGVGVPVRVGPFGTPVFPPGFGMPPVDSDLTEEDVQEAWDEASEPTYERVVDEGDKGRPIRDTSKFTVEELNALRISSILGVLGTFIWAFGDLLGGLPK